MAEAKQRTIGDLVKRLQSLDQETPIEYVICKLDNEVVDISVSRATAKPMARALKILGGLDG